ncbi:MAG: LLM class flavin-dependent oxidoreductase, partial [Rubricoccaceae bacterium]|nr:LLM class flavin-dependent oxidoreductase [Rubricoccaceae bacterium]
TGISFAAGWQPNDFIIRPEGFADRKELMFRQIEQVKALWRGEAVNFPGHEGEPVAIKTLPRPVQSELPVWITAAGNPETFREAGARGYHLLTHLLGQTVEDLADKIEIYREARKANGYDPDAGQVTLMLHTFVGDSDDEVREVVREPMKAYLKSSIGLIKAAAWSFPTFRQKTTGDNGQFSVEHLSDQALEEVLDFSFERYFETSALFGTKERCLAIVHKLKRIGVNEIACLIDYGVEAEQVLAMLPALNELRKASNDTDVRAPSVSENIERHAVTHFQCTPTQAWLLANDQESLQALGKLKQLLIGGEALSSDLVVKLIDAGIERITNMYGPTETTIWSSTRLVSGGEEGVVPLGKPIANTQFYVLDDCQKPVPIGIPGELWIGGSGVARGYWERDDLTSERFIQNPFADGRIYRTGDLVRYRNDGELEFLGRADFQVKMRGYRIELGEIEAKLSGHPDIRKAAVVVREDVPGDVRLVGYFTPKNGVAPTREALREFLGAQLPDYMVPTTFMAVDHFPMTPNQKLDRNALPKPLKQSSSSQSSERPSLSFDNDSEKDLLEIWEDVLGVEGIHPTSNFFDLGGHSLLAIQVQALLESKLGRVVRIVDLFRFPTIRSLAQHLNANGKSEEESIVSKGVSRGARRAALLTRRNN